MAVDFRKKLKLKFKTNLNFSCQPFGKFNHFEDDSDGFLFANLAKRNGSERLKKCGKFLK